MIILNITTHVCWPIDERWRQWMQETWLPKTLSTGLFTHYQMARLLELDDEEGPTYAVQLYMPNISAVKEYRDKHLHNFHLQQEKQWGDDACSFTSFMEVIN